MNSILEESVLTVKGVEKDNTLTEKSEKPTFEMFARSVELKDEIADICKQVIQLKNEE